MAAGTAADAGIVYSGILNKTATVNPVGNGSSSAIIGSLINGKNFTFQVRHNGSSMSAYNQVLVSGNVGFLMDGNQMHIYAPNQTIKGTLGYRSGLQLGHASANNGHVSRPGLYFPLNASETVGIKTTGGVLGWMKLKMSDTTVAGVPSSIKMISWAYNSVSGQTILAGQTSNAAVPEPGTMAMGLLASGAAGLVALRRAKAKAKAKAIA